MDLYKAIQDLYAEKEKLEQVIASLEELQRAGGAPPKLPRTGSRRGRKTMDAGERQEVSERMKKYWADRRRTDSRDPSPPSGTKPGPSAGGDLLS
jgi:hypothetical protein